MTEATASQDALIRVGETFARTVRFTREDIALFARLSLDPSPLHVDSQVAQRARCGEIVAGGQHTSAALMGRLASHCTTPDDGEARGAILLTAAGE